MVLSTWGYIQKALLQSNLERMEVFCDINRLALHQTWFLFLLATQLDDISQPPLQLGVVMWLGSDQWNASGYNGYHI